MKIKQKLSFFIAISLFLTSAVYAERAEVIEYNPNIQTQTPYVQPQAATAEVGMLGFVNEKFNRMERQLEDSADRMDRLERDVERIHVLEAKVAELEKKLAAFLTSAASSSTVDANKDVDANKGGSKVAITSSSSDTEAAQAAYKKAFEQLMAGKYPEAGKLFKDYLEKYPETDQSGNAYYWLGETYFVGRKFDLALKAYTQSTKLEGPKVAEALLKEGQCYLELNKNKEAKAVFEDVKKRFPDSSIAKQADKSLVALKANSDAKK
jgi:tol-pal system protein YbgF